MRVDDVRGGTDSVKSLAENRAVPMGCRMVSPSRSNSIIALGRKSPPFLGMMQNRGMASAVAISIVIMPSVTDV